MSIDDINAIEQFNEWYNDPKSDPNLFPIIWEAVEQENSDLRNLLKVAQKFYDTIFDLIMNDVFGGVNFGQGMEYICPICEKEMDQGHADNCNFIVAIKEYEGGTK